LVVAWLLLLLLLLLRPGSESVCGGEAEQLAFFAGNGLHHRPDDDRGRVHGMGNQRAPAGESNNHSALHITVSSLA
jgi:hypothetical protein